MGARQKLEMVSMMTGGRISGLFHDRPIFYITKMQKEISRIDETGKAKKTKQWLIVLDADMDMTSVFQATAPEPEPEVTGTDTEDMEGEPEFVEREEAAPIDDLRAEVLAGVELCEINPKMFAVYAAAKWGTEWARTEATLRQAMADIGAGLIAVEAYRVKVAGNTAD
jgi:hypothetical protein